MTYEEMNRAASREIRRLHAVVRELETEQKDVLGNIHDAHKSQLASIISYLKTGDVAQAIEFVQTLLNIENDRKSQPERR